MFLSSGICCSVFSFAAVGKKHGRSGLPLFSVFLPGRRKKLTAFLFCDMMNSRNGQTSIRQENGVF